MYKPRLEILINSEEYSDAISYLEEYCEKFPKELDCKFDLAMLLTNTSVFMDGNEYALELLNSFLIKNKNHLNVFLLKGYIEDTQMG